MIGERLVVVADAHLAAARPVDEARFLEFLDRTPSMGDVLLLAGDIYDFWFTYQRLIPRHCIRVTARLVELARRMPVLMLGGNHDRWGDIRWWGAETGIRFHPRELRFEIGRRRIRAVHGDGLHEERRSAAALNRVLASDFVVSAFGMLPAPVGFTVARKLGHDSEFARHHPEVVTMAAERQLRWARSALAENDTDVLIMGHTHRAALAETAPDKWYLNPGPWLDSACYAIVSDAALELHTFA